MVHKYVRRTNEIDYIKGDVLVFFVIIMVIKTYQVLLAVLVMGSVGCSKTEEELATPVETVSAETLAASKSQQSKATLQNSLPFKFGASVNIGFLQKNENYRSLVTQEFSSITAESAMKIKELHPDENTYDFADADYLINYAKQYNKRVHGHTLIWDSSLPSWIKNYKGDSKAWEKLFKTHIQTIVKHFKGRVASWDVVNEAFKDDGTLDKTTIWYKKLGPDYIARAFEYAHEADPQAILFYNDYGHEYGNFKRRGIVAYVNKLKERGVPIHGIGMQMHTRYNLSDDKFARAIKEVAATGLKVHISELDISLNPESNKNKKLTADLLKQQAAKYKFIVKTYNSIPESQQFGITAWNVTDGDSWVPKSYKRPDWPLLFDSNYQKKPAYQGVLDGVK